MMSGFPYAVEVELARARLNNSAFNSLHEGYAVLLEELDEVWEEVKRKPSERDLNLLLSEIVQVGAMAQRLAEDCVLSQALCGFTDTTLA